MKSFIFLMGLLAFFTGCMRHGLREGGLYYTPAEKGGYSVLKILKVDSGGVHVRIYSNAFDQPPEKVDEASLYLAGVDRKPNETLGMGHLPISKSSFSGWGAVFIQKSTVTDGELEGYKMWLEAKAGYF